tara:strand:+ start:963 stop:1244 length:282 start_codon:yes stop_codon:yes gene_type:complete
MKTRIHVNQHNIKANAKGADLPVLTVKNYKQNRLCNEVIISGPSRVVYSPDKPLSCGAKVWVETDSEVTTVYNRNSPRESVNDKDIHAQWALT